MFGLLCKDLWLASSNRKVGLWNLEHLGVIQFAIIDAMAVRLEAGANDGDSPSRSTHLSCSTILLYIMYY
jgi:hypothetical protein